MMQTPKVSVVIPVYKTEQYLSDCLDSVINQALAAVEIICVDDGSPDRSIDVLTQYAERDERVRIIRRENGGLCAARNTGLDLAQGEYVYFLDSDDMLADGALEKMAQRADRDALDILYFDAEAFFESEEIRRTHEKLGASGARSGSYDGVASGAERFAQMVGGGDWRPQVQRQLYRRAFLADSGLRFYEGIVHEDELFSFLAAMNAQRTGYEKAAYFLRRVRADSIMTRAYVHKNFKGYHIGYCEMMRYAMTHTFAPDVEKAVWAHLVKRRDRAMRVYAALEQTQRTGVDWTDDAMTHALFKMSEREELEKKKEDNKRLRETLDRKNRALEEARAELADIRRMPLMRVYLKLRSLAAKRRERGGKA